MLRPVQQYLVCQPTGALPRIWGCGEKAWNCWVLLFVSLALFGCGFESERSTTSLEPTSAGYPEGTITLLAPANPGGGWDQTARQLQQVWTAEGLLGVPVEVVNRGGAGGTIGLADLVTRYRDDSRMLMVFGQVMLGAILTNDSPVLLKETVPLARLLSEYEVVAVPPGSPYGSLPELMAEFRRNPEGVSWAGGSAGGIDHMLVGLLAQAAGINPSRINYIAHSGGGQAAVAVMGGHVTAGVSGLGEWKGHVEAGRMRLLAVSAPERVGDGMVPTIREMGFDVAIANWRGIVAPPGTDTDTRDWLINALSDLRESEAWQEILRENEWEDSFLTGSDFDDFLRQETATVDMTLRSIGLVR